MNLRTETELSASTLSQAAECLRTLAHPVRLRMVDLILRERHTVGELAAACEVRPHVASEHLRLMERCGLLTKEKDGRQVYYLSAHNCLDRILTCVRTQFEK